MYTIYIVSDGSGRTAKQALDAAMTQFRAVEVKIIQKSKVRTEHRVRQIVQDAKKTKGFIVHTLVSNPLRLVLQRSSRK